MCTPTNAPCRASAQRGLGDSQRRTHLPTCIRKCPKVLGGPRVAGRHTCIMSPRPPYVESPYHASWELECSGVRGAKAEVDIAELGKLREMARREAELPVEGQADAARWQTTVGRAVGSTLRGSTGEGVAHGLPRHDGSKRGCARGTGHRWGGGWCCQVRPHGALRSPASPRHHPHRHLLRRRHHHRRPEAERRPLATSAPASRSPAPSSSAAR